MASFRVKIDNSTNSWIVKPVQADDKHSFHHNHGHSHHHRNMMRKNNSNSGLNNQSKNSLSNMNQNGTNVIKNLDRKKSNSENNLLGDEMLNNRRRSTSTSYIGQEDDYDNNFCSKEDLRQFRRQLSLEDHLNKLAELSGGKQQNSARKNEDYDMIKDKSDETVNPMDAYNLSKISNNNSSSRESSDTEYDSDNNDDLYAIDEYDECVQNIDCDPGKKKDRINFWNKFDFLSKNFYFLVEIKKDPSGLYYKRISFNIYQELFTTKLYEKLWPSSINDSINSTSANPLTNGSFSESFFEKLARMEFEASIYNQMPCAKILYTYFEQIFYNEIKLLKTTKPSNTIIVNPITKTSSNENISNDNNTNSPTTKNKYSNYLLSSEVKNLKSIRKKLSLTILELGL
jgi:hypothetical protein